MSPWKIWAKFESIFTDLKGGERKGTDFRKVSTIFFIIIPPIMAKNIVFTEVTIVFLLAQKCHLL